MNAPLPSRCTTLDDATRLNVVRQERQVPLAAHSQAYPPLLVLGRLDPVLRATGVGHVVRDPAIAAAFHCLISRYRVLEVEKVPRCASDPLATCMQPWTAWHASAPTTSR